MEFIFRILGIEFAWTVGPVQYEEEELGGNSALGSHLDFGFGLDPLNLDPYWDSED